MDNATMQMMDDALKQMTEDDADDNITMQTTMPQCRQQCRNADNDTTTQMMEDDADNNSAKQTTMPQHRQ